MAGAGDGWWRARASTRSVRKCLAYPNAGILQHVPATPATHEPFIPRLALLRRPQAQPEAELRALGVSDLRVTKKAPGLRLG